MRPIDIDSLSEDELIELNHKVVARLRFLSQMRSTKRQSRLSPTPVNSRHACSLKLILPAQRVPTQTAPASFASPTVPLKGSGTKQGCRLPNPVATVLRSKLIALTASKVWGLEITRKNI